MESGQRYPNVAVIPASHDHTATVIFIHGLGQSNLTWRMVILEALAPRFPYIRWILPQAPRRIICGHRRPSWFNVARIPPGLNEFDERGIAESIGVIEDLILSQVHNGIDSRRIVLDGFGQGAALSMMVALSSLYYLGGVISMSGWIPPRARYMLHASPHLSVLWCHGTADQDLPISHGQDAISFLQNSMRIHPAQLQTRFFHHLSHAINDSELEVIANWLHYIFDQGNGPASSLFN